MQAKAGIFFIFCLLFLVDITGAVGIPDTVIVTSSKSWLVADNVDQSTITVSVTNTTPGYSGVVSGVYVTLSVDPVYGTVGPATVVTDQYGTASGTFKVKTKSGTAQIIATINALGLSDSIIQNIDHDSPYYVNFVHPFEGKVSTEALFTLSVTDRFGNRIDNLNPDESHTISLHVYGPVPDDCGFKSSGGYSHDISSDLDANGNLSVNIRLTSAIGSNNILMDSFGSIPDKLETIIAVSTEPWSINQDYFPSGAAYPPTYYPTLPADGTSQFTIVYTVTDKYGNPANNQSIWINSSLAGEHSLFQSNSQGQIWVSYGPKSQIGVIDIRATAVANSTVTCSQMVEFTNTAAVNMELTANPETMASLDVPPSSSTSDITVMVTDAMGNPVENEPVTFSLGLIQYPGGPYNVTSLPSLSGDSATTDAHGQAKVQFVPGSFSTDLNAVNYNRTATGVCTVTAIWKTMSRNIQVTWKNYPFISVTTSVSPQTIAVNDTVDVTVAFNGDGWAMQRKPVDAILVIDRSGSMGSNNVGGVTRMQAAKNAAKTFVAKMDPTTDRLGLVSYSYENSVALDAALGTSFGTINSRIDGLVSNGATAMREGFRTAIQEMISKPKPGAVRAVILMTDGNWNEGGSPLAVGKGYGYSSWVDYNRNRYYSGTYYGFSPYATDFEDEDYRWYTGLGGSTSASSNRVVYKPVKIDPATGVVTSGRIYETRSTSGSYCANGQFTSQNMSIYAQTNNIRLYTISFAQVVPDSERIALTILANSTGGFYKHAPTEADLADVYQEIANDLGDVAGVNTTMKADFSNVNVTGVTVPGIQVYDYVYNSTASTRIEWPDGTQNVTDQSADWASDHQLDFNIGSLKVNETWTATFRLKVKQSGSIDVFGPDSIIIFNDGASTLTIPHTFLTVVPNLATTPMTSKMLFLKNLTVTRAGNYTDLVPLQWDLNYTGHATATETMWYSFNNPNGPYTQFDSVSGISPTSGYIPRYAHLVVKKFPPGRYWIKVHATAPDSADAETGPVEVTVGSAGIFIKLE